MASNYKVRVSADDFILTDRSAPFYIAAQDKQDDEVVVTLVINDSKRTQAFAYLEKHLPGFDWLADEMRAGKEPRTWGGKRESAGRPKSERSDPLYQQGYQAGYKAGLRKAQEAQEAQEK